MNVLDRVLNGVTRYSRLVIVVLLLATVVIGSGAPMVKQTSSLEEFQSGTSQAAHAQEYITENFTEGSSNTTTAQIIVRDDNIISKLSLIEQLELQQALRENETINKTLANDSQTVGVANVISTAAVQMDRAEQLKARADKLKQQGNAIQNRSEQLKQRSDALNESKSELEQRGERLKQRGEKLEQRGEQLKQRGEKLNQSQKKLQQRGEELEQRAKELNQSQRELEQRGAALKERADELNESSRELQKDGQELEQRAKALNQSQRQLERDGAALKQRAEELNESRTELEQRKRELEQRARSINETRASLAERRAELEQQWKELAADRKSGTVPPDELERRAQKLKQKSLDLANDTAALKERADRLQADRNELERDGAALRERARSLNESRAELEQRKRQLEQEGKELEAESESLEQRKQQLEAKGEELEADQNALEQDAQQLEAKGEQLKADKNALEQDAQQLEVKGEELKADKNALEQDAQQLEKKQSALENDSAKLKKRGQTLQNDSDELKSDANKLEQRTDELEADRDELRNGSLNLSLSERIDVLESRNQSEIETVVEAVLGKNGRNNGSEQSGVFAFMPTNYEPGTTTANATMVLITQTSESETSAQGTASDRLIESQLAVRDVTRGQYADNAYVFGAGIISDEIDRSMTDSLIIVGPLALLFVLIVLVIAYRDLLDILLGVFGIALVLVWTFGFMGWADISFSQIFIAVPVLLIGLSIDYAIHVFMRHRESREQIKGVRNSMNTALGGIASALVLVTLTAVIGFLSNLTSSVPPIREFGIVSSVGICAALVIFGVLIPALKVELDSALEARGWNRTKRAFGTGGGTLGSLLSGGATAARRAPQVVLVVALLLTVAGGIGASQVDTSFSQEDFLADDPPAWMDSLPEPLAPSEYTAKSSLEYVNDRFLREDSNAVILIRGDVTDPNTLTAVERAEQNASDQDATVVLSSGESDIESPLSVMETVAADNESFNETFVESDTNGDGVPDTNLDRVYDALYEANPQAASSVVYRNDGEYEALRVSVSIKGGASGDEVTEQMRTVAGTFEGSNNVQATATGQPIVFKLVQDQLLETVVESLLITLVVTFVFLMFVYRFLHGSALLGFVTLLPVGFSVAWILGTMYVLSIPFNMITGLITSLTVGLGIAYSIHLSERYSLELQEGASAWQALQTAVTGTGGALLGSAATTVGGFGVLAFAILPPLRQFGIITGLTIIYAFLASVFVLPSLLVVWTRWFGPRGSIRSRPSSFEFGDETPSTDDD